MAPARSPRSASEPAITREARVVAPDVLTEEASGEWGLGMINGKVRRQLGGSLGNPFFKGFIELQNPFLGILAFCNIKVG